MTDETHSLEHEEQALNEQDEELAGPVDDETLENEEKARAEEYYQRMLRLQADLDNFRRRTRQEKEDWFRMAAEEFAQALLPVLDNFDLALANPGNDLEQFLTGVRMIRGQLHETLGNQGLEPLTSVGEPFDPTRHEAVSQVTGSGQPEDTVVDEIRKGYLFKGRVLRPAMVRVAKS